MPFGFGPSSGGKSPYKDLERAPLSARDGDDDDDDGMPLPPYSDAPPPPSATERDGGDDDGGGTPTDGGRRTAGRKGKGRNKSVAVLEEGDARPQAAREQDQDDDYDDDDGFGERDFSLGSSPSAGGGRGRRRPKYRAGLAFAYLRHWATCACLGRCVSCCAEDAGTRRTRRNIAGGYSPLDDKRCRCAKRMLMGLFYLALLAVILSCAMAIGYIVARDGSFEPADASSLADSDGGGGNKLFNGGKKGSGSGSGGLPPPPSDLHEICTDWITSSGRERCREECHAGLCCALPATDKDSCWAESAADCATYRAACMALELHSDSTGGDGDWSAAVGGGGAGVDVAGGGGGGGSGEAVLDSTVALDAPMPSYLSQICSTDSLNTPDGFARCSEACRPSRCCHPETYGCVVLDEDARYCDAYEGPCANVAESWRGSGHVAAAAATPSDDGGAGSASGGGPVSAPGTSLPNQTAAPDQSVNGAVIRACNSANLNPPDGCVEACYLGACCYASDSFPPIEQLFDARYGKKSPFATAESCRDQVGFCQQFGSCEHLNHLKDASGWHSDDVTYELDISGVCRATHIARNGALECSNVCQPAHCCFSGEYECDDVQLGHLDCEDYTACGVLYPNTAKSAAELFLMAKRIDEACAEDLVDTPRGRAGCQELCRERLCCFEEGEYGCANDSSQNCIAYAGCETLVSTQEIYFGDGRPKGADVPTTKKNDLVVVEPEWKDGETIEAACSATTSLDTLEGIKLCHDKCQAHLCCFASYSTAEGEACDGAHPDACAAYAPCERLVAPRDATVPYGGDAGDGPDDGLDGLDAIADRVSRACDLPTDGSGIDGAWVAACHEACAARLCCLLDARLGSNCRAAVGARECAAYGPCDVLINGKTGMEITSAGAIEDKVYGAELEAVCNVGVRRDSVLYDQCETRCKERSCCFEDRLEYSCYAMEKEWCEEFRPCSFVDFTFMADASGPSGWSGTPNSFVDVPTTTSLPTTTASHLDELRVSFEAHCKPSLLLRNWKICQGFCSDFECCFRDTDACDEKDPTEEFEDECDDFSACEIFFEEEDDLPTGNPSSAEISNPTEVSAPTTTASHLDELRVSFEAHCKPGLLLRNWKICQGVCSDFECCFRDTDACDEEDPTECDEFFACEIFFKEQDDLPTGNPSSAEISNPTEVSAPNFNEFEASMEAACSPNSLRTLAGVEQCYDKCQAHLCCVPADALEQDFDCSETYPDVCNKYYVCENLVSSFDLWEPPSKVFFRYAVKNEVDEACDLPEGEVTEEWLANCHRVCAARMCCLAHPTLGSNCVDVLGKDECDDYSACKVLIGGEERDSNNIYDFCNSDVSSNKARFLECEKQCKTRSCCFEDKPDYSCYYMETDWCNEYEACNLVGMTFFEGESSATVSTDQGGITTTKSTLPRGIDDLCNENVSSDKLLFSDCRQECKTRSCCFEDKDFSCYEQDEEWCEEYKACAHVGFTFTVAGNKPVATVEPSNVSGKEKGDQIDTKCSREYILAFGLEECGMFCESVSCCFSFSQCQYPVPSDCGYFKSCDNYYNPKTDDLIIEKFCTEEELDENVGPCRDKCKPYECCFTNDACPSTIKAQCDQYEPCRNYYENYAPEFEVPQSYSPGSGLPVAENKPVTAGKQKGDQIDTKCSREYLLASGLEECGVLCESVSCCFSFSQCAYPVPSDCEYFASCDNFYDPKTEDLIIEKFCSEEELEENEGPCQDKCKPYECCFTNDACPSTINAQCSQYEPCRNYFETFAPEIQVSHQGRPRDDFEVLCSSESKLKQNENFCRSRCSPYACCFEVPENSCYRSKPLECERYYICEEFSMGIVGGGDDSSTRTKTVAAPVPSPTNSGISVSNPNSMQQSFKTLCTQSTLAQNWETCKNHCSEFECCFSLENSCYQQKRLECNEYYICEEFYEDKEEENVAFKALCTPSNLQQNWDTCKSLCSEFECCFTNGNSCYQEKKQGCDEHYICEDIYGEEDSEFKALCTPSNLQKNWDICKSQCSEFECCFSNANSCYQEKKQECDEHYICEDFYEEEGYSGFKAQCAPSNLRRNWDACKSQCSAFECCFVNDNNANSCYEENSQECDEHMLCEEFYMTEEQKADKGDDDTYHGGSGDALLEDGGLGDALLEAMQYRCSASRLEGHLKDCAEWCIPYECCFSSSSSCRLANKHGCDEHDVCKLVFNRSTTVPGVDTGRNPSSSVSNPAGINNSPSQSMANSAQTMDEGLDATELAILENACEIKQLRISDSECRMLCKGSECCFNESQPCNGMERFCNDHVICSRMFG